MHLIYVAWFIGCFLWFVMALVVWFTSGPGEGCSLRALAVVSFPIWPIWVLVGTILVAFHLCLDLMKGDW